MQNRGQGGVIETQLWIGPCSPRPLFSTEDGVITSAGRDVPSCRAKDGQEATAFRACDP